MVVSIGDSTFFHAGIPALINAVIQQARIIVVILDNGTTAMTGGQPVPHLGIAAGGKKTQAIAIEPIVRAAGVGFMESCDPYDHERFERILKDADAYTRRKDGGVAVVISRRACIMDPAVRREKKRNRAFVTEECIGCRTCIDEFECPALLMDEDNGVAVVDVYRCIGCGNCIPVCPVGAIIEEEK